MTASSPSVRSLGTRQLCPFLPQEFRSDFTAAHIHKFKKDRSVEFYLTTLEYGQKLWMDGLPAQALLMINRALSCQLPELSLNLPHQSPYLAVAWLLQNRDGAGFIGNPRRHYQHLATRMVEPLKELRTWRAWACWQLATQILPDQSFPPDVQQFWKEQVVEPTTQQIQTELLRLSPSNDFESWNWAKIYLHGSESLNQSAKSVAPWTAAAVTQPEHLNSIKHLAHQIWPECYATLLESAQIDYMLAKGYSQEKLQSLASNPNYHFFLLHQEGHPEPFGFFSYEIHPQAASVHLDKIYFLATHRNGGLGASVLQWLFSHFRALGLSKATLRVNKHNYRAISAYTRAGMCIHQAVTSDIGKGFVMDDYELSINLKPHKN